MSDSRQSTNEVRFAASIAPLQSAMTIASDGGARVKIDIPESDIDQAYKLMAWRNQPLEITVRLCQQNRQEQANGREDQDIVSTRTGRKSTWATAEE